MLIYGIRGKRRLLTYELYWLLALQVVAPLLVDLLLLSQGKLVQLQAALGRLLLHVAEAADELGAGGVHQLLAVQLVEARDVDG